MTTRVVRGILTYFARSRLEVCDFNLPVFVRAKLRFSPLGTARRLDSFVLPPLDLGFLWSTSTLSGKEPFFFSYSRRPLCRSA